MTAMPGFRTTNMTSKGQVLIPKEVRDRVGLVPGKPVRVGVNDRGEAVIEPAETLSEESRQARRARARAMIEAMTGIWADGGTTDEFMREVRGDDPFPP
jgi:antitoxin PrlF